MHTPRVYIVNLNSYNNGNPRGQWFELPADYRNVQRMLRLDEEHGEEYAIHDHENFVGYQVKELSSIRELNAYAEKLKELEEEVDHLEEILEIYPIDEVLSNKEDLDFVEAKDDEDLAQELIAQMGGVEALGQETLERYFDFSAFGRDLTLTDYAPTTHGYVRRF
jgi:antirestriction protein